MRTSPILLTTAVLTLYAAAGRAQSADGAAAPPHMRHHRAAVVATDGGAGTGARPGHEPGVGESYPASSRASNIQSGDSRSDIAPRLPEPKAGDQAPVEAYLRDAQHALAAKRTGEAQEALERAQTRLLDRSVPQGETGTPASDPMVATVEQARQALGRGDAAGANRLITQALSGRG